MQIIEDRPPGLTDPVHEARVAIWRLFQEGYVDEDMATAGLLAVDLGTRRARRKSAETTRVARVRADLRKRTFA
jgi:hypothetical protein